MISLYESTTLLLSAKQNLFNYIFFPSHIVFRLIFINTLKAKGYSRLLIRTKNLRWWSFKCGFSDITVFGLSLLQTDEDALETTKTRTESIKAIVYFQLVGTQKLKVIIIILTLEDFKKIIFIPILILYKSK